MAILRCTQSSHGSTSPHHSGALFALGADSVRFLAQSINDATYQQLGHRADGKLIKDDF